MKRLLFALVILAVACSGSPTESVNVNIVETVDLSDSTNEAFLIEQTHRGWAQQLGIVFDDLWYRCGSTPSVDSSTWPDNRQIKLTWPEDRTMWVEFKDIHYDPEASDINFGPSPHCA